MNLLKFLVLAILATKVTFAGLIGNGNTLGQLESLPNEAKRPSTSESLSCMQSDVPVKIYIPGSCTLVAITEKEKENYNKAKKIINDLNKFYRPIMGKLWKPRSEGGPSEYFFRNQLEVGKGNNAEKFIHEYHRFEDLSSEGLAALKQQSRDLINELTRIQQLSNFRESHFTKEIASVIDQYHSFLLSPAKKLYKMFSEIKEFIDVAYHRLDNHGNFIARVTLKVYQETKCYVPFVNQQGEADFKLTVSRESAGIKHEFVRDQDNNKVVMFEKMPSAYTRNYYCGQFVSGDIIRNRSVSF